MHFFLNVALISLIRWNFLLFHLHSRKKLFGRLKICYLTWCMRNNGVTKLMKLLQGHIQLNFRFTQHTRHYKREVRNV